MGCERKLAFQGQRRMLSIQRQAIFWASQSGSTDIVLEGDCQVLIQELNNPGDCFSNCGLIVVVLVLLNMMEIKWKRALLCGVSYKKGKHRLSGTINDVTNVRDLLINTFQFRPENILVLSEEESEANLIPTKNNIIEALKWLVKDNKDGDSLVFYFSGHGLRQPDFSDDEIDGFDETICPVDFMEAGMILDNDINKLIVSPLKEGVTLHAIVDSCHSGTILDLEYIYDRQQKAWANNHSPSGRFKSTKGGLAISISACNDAEFAADTSAFSSGKMNGAMTYLMIDAIRKEFANNNNNSMITYGHLIDKIYSQIDEVSRTGCLGNARLIRGIFGKRIIQKPQLSSSQPFPVYERLFKL
ncbi:metacaspase-1-like [Rutidosis leptorrhynchoides]|uniref:metacaspase-1-like n=1 Tax=Rutidosis leptorrhynchoides TaxID=125765 RepID=UPI003A99346C